MPTYDFKCTQCQHTFELELKLAERAEKNHPAKVCPHCQSRQVEQMMTFQGAISAKGASACGLANQGCLAANTSCCAGGGCPHSHH